MNEITGVDIVINNSGDTTFEVKYFRINSKYLVKNLVRAEIFYLKFSESIKFELTTSHLMNLHQK